MNAEENVSDLCRICAKSSNQAENLFETQYNEMVLSEMLKFCLKRQILKENSLPRTICFDCKSSLILTYDFLNLCETSEKYLLTKYSLQEVNDDLTFPQCTFPIDDNNQSNDVNTILIKCEEDDDDDDDFGYKDNNSVLASEIICVDEKFNEDNVIAAQIPVFDDDDGDDSSIDVKNQRLVTLRRRAKQTAIEQRIYECYECKKSFQQLRELRNHIHDHDDISRKPFECRTCNLRFMHINSWFRHRSRHTKNIHNCEYCEADFNSIIKLKRHIQEMHKERINAYRCDQCSEKFSLKFLLIWHYEWHKKAKQLVCNTCDAIFYNERKLKTHIRDNHASHLCAECGKSFKTIHLLASHQMLHTSEKPFACDLCPSRFKWKTALTTHMLVHTGQKQHVCDMCGASFTTKGSMKKHKRIHTGDRRYECETCTKKFYSSDHLKRHIRTHTGERPYHCSYCSRSFSQSNDLTKHIRSHVGLNMYRCHCGASFRLQTELRKHSYTHYNQNEPIKSIDEQKQ